MRKVGMTVTRFNMQELSTGDYPQVAKDEVLVGGAVYEKGSVLAKLTGGAHLGKLTLATNNAPANGNDAIYAVLAEGIDATAGDTNSRVTITGQFDKNELVFAPGGYTGDTAEAYLRSVRSSLFFEDSVTPPSVE